jgi:hypothetical protein
VANNYETVTVLKRIPEKYISKAHIAMLLALGYALEGSAYVSTIESAAEPEGSAYIYAEESCGDLRDAIENVIDEDGRRALGLGDDGEADRVHPLVKAAEAGESIDAMDVLQDILKGIPESELQYIDVQAGYRCDKARPGEHGGWAARIWRNGKRFGGTQQFFDDLNGENQRINDLDVLCQVAARASITDAEKAAVARVTDHIANHPALEDDESD